MMAKAGENGSYQDVRREQAEGPLVHHRILQHAKARGPDWRRQGRCRCLLSEWHLLVIFLLKILSGKDSRQIRFFMETRVQIWFVRAKHRGYMYLQER